MAGFVWKHELVAEADEKNAWCFTLTTKRRWYNKTFWDEQVTAVSMDERGQVITTYRELVREDLEQVIFVAHVQDGGIIEIYKDDRLDSYWLITAGEAYWLAADFAEVVQNYRTEERPPAWLIEQIQVRQTS